MYEFFSLRQLGKGSMGKTARKPMAETWIADAPTLHSGREKRGKRSALHRKMMVRSDTKPCPSSHKVRTQPF